MRAVTALLLLLMLPGLLLPAGVSLRVCLCPPATAGQPSCCGEAAAPRSCCGHGERSPAGDPDGDPERERTCGRGDCRCVWIQVPDDAQPTAPVPALEFATAPPPVFAAVAHVPAAAPPAHRRWPAADNRPPPPDRQPSLPLRL